MTLTEAQKNTNFLFYSTTPEFESNKKKWLRLIDLTLASNLIENIHKIHQIYSPNSKIYTKDQIYMMGHGIPILRQEVVFASNKKVKPGFVVEFRNSVKPQPFEITFATQTILSPEIYEDGINLSKPKWLPFKYRHLNFCDLTLEEDYYYCKKGTDGHLIQGGEFYEKSLEFPFDADFSYLWERSKSIVEEFLLKLKTN